MKPKATRSNGGRTRFAALAGLLAFVVLPADMAAQVPLPRLLDEFSVQGWGRDEGMPEVAVVSLAQSADGFVWCQTPNHLLRFDGRQFEDHDQLDTGPSQDPYPILFRGWTLDGETPWIFGSRGAMRRTANGWRRLEMSLGYRAIVGMITDWENQFWAVTEDGVCTVNDDRLVIVTNAPRADELHRITSAAADWTRGGLLLGSEAGLFRFQNQAYEPVVAGAFGKLSGVSCLVRGRSNNWWVCCHEGLLHERESTWQRQALPFPPDQATTLLEDSTGAIWVGTKQGLYRGAEGTWSKLSASDVANPVNVICLMEDDQHRIWVGTGDGLLCLRPKQVKVLFAQPRQGRQIITSLAILGGTNVWVGSLNEGLLRVENNRLQPVSDFHLPPGVTISALGPARDGGLWVGTVGGYLYHFDGQRETQIADARNSLYSGREVTAILDAGSNRVWVGTWQGLFTLADRSPDRPGARLEPVPMKNTDGSSSPFVNRVTALAAEADNTLWIGYEGLWILRRDPSGTIPVHGFGWGLPGPTVRATYRDQSGKLWVGGSRGLGLQTTPEWRQANDPKMFWKAIRLSNGLLDEDIRQIVEDDQGRLWLGTRKGIEIFDRNRLVEVMDGKITGTAGQRIGLAEGMVSDECTVNSSPGSGRDAAGRIYFATTDGLVVADPARFTAATNLPPVYLQTVTTGDKVIYQRHAPSPISRPGSPETTLPRDSVTLPIGQRNVSFAFTTPAYDAPDRLRFRWRLEQADADWTAPSENRTATYPRLAPGEYTFRVMAGGQGVWRELETPFKFRIRHNFHERTEVRITLGLLLAATLALIVWGLERQRGRRRIKRLEREGALERERTRISRDLHDELGVGLTEIGLLGDLAAGPSATADPRHELPGEISARARSLVTALDEIVWAINPANDNSLSLGDYFSRYAQTLLQRAGLRCQLDVADVSTEALVNADQRHHLFLAFKETLNNVITHARATEVSIRLAVERDELIVRVADDGCGLAGRPGEGSRDGLRNLRERLANIGGGCQIESAAGHGTTITFTLPVKHKSRL